MFYLLFILFIRFVVFVYRLVNKVDHQSTSLIEPQRLFHAGTNVSKSSRKL